MKEKVCELCKGEANLYCESDSAFLCWNCDASVHGANFLVARHIRLTVCCKCKGFDGNRFSGGGVRPIKSICRSCLPESGDQGCGFESESSSSSACISSSESCATAKPKKKIGLRRRLPEKIGCSSSLTEVSVENSRLPVIFSVGDSSKKKKTLRSRAAVAPAKNIDAKAEGILVNWCRKLGLKNASSVTLASHALGICLQKFTVLPFRVSLASALWFSLKIFEGRSASSCQNLKKLEEISGVPSKLIVLAESKLARVLKKCSHSDQEEGWAECSD